MNITDIKFNQITDKSRTSGAQGRENSTADFLSLLRSNINSTGNKNYKSRADMDSRLKDLCVQMESLFVSKMLKSMKATVPKNEFIHGGFAEDIFQDMLYDEYALSISRNEKMGIASMLYDELSRK